MIREDNASGEETGSIQIEKQVLTQIRHPIKAAHLLYTPPNYVLRGPIYLVFIVVFVALLYSFWAKKDELVTAPLSLIRESTQVNSIVGGLVVAVNVKEGEHIEPSARLVDIQVQTSVSMITEPGSLTEQLRDLIEKKDIAINEHEHSLRQLELSLEKIVDNKTLQIQKYDKEMADLPIQKLALLGRVKTLEKQYAKAERDITYLTNKLNRRRDQFKITEELYENKDITRPEYDREVERIDDLEKMVIDKEDEQDQQEIALSMAKEELIKLTNKKERLITSHRQFLNNSESQEVKIRNEIDQLKERYERQSERVEKMIHGTEDKIKVEQHFVHGVTYDGKMVRYTSTIAGVVTKVHIKHGHVINPGTPLVTIVKDEAALNGRILVHNKDIGHLKKGQKVQIKYFAYPYQEYGIQTGLISKISTTPTDASGPASMYQVNVALDRETIRTRSGKEKRLEIGLEGIAEIKTGEKRLIEILFSPVSKFFSEEE